MRCKFVMATAFGILLSATDALGAGSAAAGSVARGGADTVRGIRRRRL